jgi:DNA-binding NtrC family response regulator
MLSAGRTAMGELHQSKSAPEKKSVKRTVHAFAPDPESILLLEDDDTFGESLQSFLKAHSFTVTRLSDCAEGLRRIGATDFDIVLCEMVMAGLSAERFYQAVERTKPHLCKRFVFMTEGTNDPQTEEFILRVRALALRKPFPLTDLLTAIAIAWKRSPETGGKRSLAHTAFAST